MGPVLLCAAFVFSACGDNAATTTSSVFNLDTTNYHTLPPTPTTFPTTSTPPGGSLPPGQTTPPGGTTTGVTQYVVAAGDYPSKVAHRFGITTTALDQANTDTGGYGSFYIGLKINIPAGATVPTSTIPPTSSLPDLTGGKGTKCVRGTYTIQKGDLPTSVAKMFNLTRAQLDAANVNTKGYTNFVTGSKIIIPAAKTGC